MMLYFAVLLGASGAFLTTNAMPMSSGVSTSQGSAVYASVGSELIHYDLSVDQAELTKRDSVRLPGSVQYAWPHPSGKHLYVISSGGERGPPVHSVTAFDIEAGTGALHMIGQPINLKYRPIHVTTDRDGTHLLVVYNIPPSITVYKIAADGAIGEEVKQPSNLDLGIYVHQVRVEPSNKTVVIIARGNYETQQDPGAIKIFDYKDGVLSNRTSVAPGDGSNFNPRHMDFDKTEPWGFVTLEAQNKLQVFHIDKDGVFGKTPLFVKDTLAAPGNVKHEYRQLTGTVHEHPNGRVIYTANRGTGVVTVDGKQVFAGGENNIAVFDINRKTGEPTLVQNVDTHGIIPRTFAVDPSGRILVAANQDERLVRGEGGALTKVPRRLSVFRIRADGKLDFVRTYDVDDAQHGNLFWVNILAVPR